MYPWSTFISGEQMREKILRNWQKVVIYDEKHWELLKSKRQRGVKILEILKEYGIDGYIFGSVARGDVHQNSDIDIIIFKPPKPYLLEYLIEEKIGVIYAREIIQATPHHAIKAHIYVDPLTIISFPLVPFTRLEYEFYKFGGLINLKSARNVKERVAGVDKRLVLIIPTEKGHIEQSIIDNESYVSKILGVSIDIIRERVSVLTKRDEKGRTGVFLKRILSPDESFEMVLRELENTNPMVRRLIKSRGLVI